ncbi:MAG TPA: lanthionine synthetase LanC family protein, partial [Verrucomicrobiae bacterium]|nr:lanthionine synthetase LanC family protein [Verrucomicrobiae bacterium]
IEAGRILEHEGLVRRGVDALLGLRQANLEPHMLDVISGCAGAIPVLIRSARMLEKQALIETAVRFGEHLLACAIKTDDGWGWDTMAVPDQPPLTGYSHGAAGVVRALLELHQITQEARYREAALEGLRYERRHFVAEQGNWRDLRKVETVPAPAQPICCLAWCHGAPGAGMARLRAAQLLGNDPVVLGEAQIAVQTTLGALARPVTPGAGNYSLCHGAGGNAELLILSADFWNRPDLRATAEGVGVAGIEVFEKPGLPWPCGVANAGETPNLLLGLAGIGYFYLRLHQPDQVPSVLLVDIAAK